MSTMDRRSFVGLGGVAALTLGVVPRASARDDRPRRVAKNLIFMVSDGMSFGTLSLADTLIRQQHNRPSNWIQWMQREGDWPAPLYRRPDIEGLQRLRAPFAEGMIDKLPKGVRDKDAPAAHCSVCLGYHKPASIHLSYIGHARVTDRLNSIDPLWFWTPYAEDPITGLPLLDYDSQNRPCGMWMKLHVCGKTMIGYGTTEPKPDAIKELIGDALRNAAMRLGVALGMWVKGEMESLADTPESLGQQAAAAKPPERDPQTKQPKITKPQADDLVAMFDDITDDDERKKAKREWLDAFSIRRPGDLTQDHHDGAKLWIAARLDSHDAQAAPQEATDGPPEGGSTAESATNR